jgi:hypothetical protein
MWFFNRGITMELLFSGFLNVCENGRLLKTSHTDWTVNAIMARRHIDDDSPFE